MHYLLDFVASWNSSMLQRDRNKSGYEIYKSCMVLRKSMLASDTCFGSGFFSFDIHLSSKYQRLFLWTGYLTVCPTCHLSLFLLFVSDVLHSPQTRYHPHACLYMCVIALMVSFVLVHYSLCMLLFSFFPAMYVNKINYRIKDWFGVTR